MGLCAMICVHPPLILHIIYPLACSISNASNLPLHPAVEKATNLDIFLALFRLCELLIVSRNLEAPRDGA